ncbi:Di-copper centre-containing protein [Testicularia cyperi]|uniref:Di-copper centre-containing protein n=1 Tax=Testicularia cyperi TaxID=1882483 RepID=A0A317XLV9_9BASI|nr:Di-copper centre-containing protein [Testicularia cyperi]
MRRHMAFWLVWAAAAVCVHTTVARLSPRMPSSFDARLLARRATSNDGDLSTPQAKASSMLACIGHGASGRADSGAIQAIFQATPPPSPDLHDKLFTISPSKWGISSSNSDELNDWKKDGKSAHSQRVIDRYTSKLSQCLDRLASRMVSHNTSNTNAAVSPRDPANPATSNQSPPTSNDSQDDSAAKNTSTGGSGVGGGQSNNGTVNGGNPPGKSDSTGTTGATTNDPSKPADSTPGSGSAKPAPGLGAEANSVPPTLDPDNKLMPKPDPSSKSGTDPTTGDGSSLAAVAAPANADSSVPAQPASTDPGAANSAIPSGSNCTQIVERKEYSTLTNAEKKAYVDAIKCLRRKPSRYGDSNMNALDDWTLLHMQMIKYVHFTAYFLPFHRGFVAIAERDLRECGFPLGMPWIDWTQHSDDPSASAIFNGDPTFGFGTDGKGSNSNCAFGSGKQVTDGAFANMVFNAPFQHNLCRQFNNLDVQQPNPHWGSNCTTFLTEQFVNGVMTTHTDGKFFDFAAALEVSTHYAVHVCMGGNMPWLSASTNDPGFMLHHAFMDAIFTSWQNQSPSNKNAFHGPKKQNRDGKFNPWDATADDVMNFKPLAPNAKVSDLLDPQKGLMGGLMCYRYSFNS